MKRVCLQKEEINAIKSALKSGDVSLTELSQIKSSQERRDIFKKYLSEEQAILVNAKFEQALLSNQKKSMVNWVKSVTTKKDPIRKDMLKKVERNEKILDTVETDAFLEDLAKTKLGLDVSDADVKQIMKLRDGVDIAKRNIDRNSKNGSESRMIYGYALDDFKKFVGDLKLKKEDINLKDRLKSVNYGKNIVDTANVSKSILASSDVSFPFRQGIKLLLAGKYGVWGKSFTKSLELFGREMFSKSPKMFKSRSDAVLRTLRAQIYSRENALNGKYNAAKNGYNLGVLHEEAIPTALPEKLPVLGRLFKASQTAYEGGAMQMRADYADFLISQAEKNGVDMLDEINATAFGSIVGGMTGRSGVGRLEPIAGTLNALFFAPRFLASNINVLTAHAFDKSITPEARKVAIANIAKIATSLAVVLITAKALKPDSVDFDSRGSHFGKIKAGQDLWVDVTGGMNGLVTLGTRILTGQNKSVSTGKIIDMQSGNFGSKTVLDTIEQFIEGKFSPVAGLFRDLAKGRDFSGEKVTLSSIPGNYFVPITAQGIYDDLKKGRDNVLLSAITEGFGLSTSRGTIYMSGDKAEKLKSKIGEVKFEKEISNMKKVFEKKMEVEKRKTSWGKKTNEEKNKVIDKIMRGLKRRLYSKYGIIK